MLLSYMTFSLSLIHSLTYFAPSFTLAHSRTLSLALLLHSLPRSPSTLPPLSLTPTPISPLLFCLTLFHSDLRNSLEWSRNSQTAPYHRRKVNIYLEIPLRNTTGASLKPFFQPAVWPDGSSPSLESQSIHDLLTSRKECSATQGYQVERNTPVTKFLASESCLIRRWRCQTVCYLARCQRNSDCAHWCWLKVDRSRTPRLARRETDRCRTDPWRHQPQLDRLRRCCLTGAAGSASLLC